jgi:hypothetical protein
MTGNKSDNSGWIILGIIAVAFIFLSQQFAAIGNYTPSGGTAHWDISDDGKWAYIWFTGQWDIFVPAERKLMLELDETKGLHIYADRNYYGVLDQWVKTDGSYNIGNNANFFFWGKDDGVMYPESDRPYVVGNIFDGTVVGKNTPISGAKVMIADKVATTDSKGEFTLYLDKGGSQTIIVSATNFKQYTGTISLNPTGQSLYSLGMEKDYVCVPDLVCSDWGVCTDGSQERTCSDGCGAISTRSQACEEPNINVCDGKTPMPCTGAEWQDYPICGWSIVNCESEKSELIVVVENASGDPIEGATVEVNLEEQTTSDTGEATYSITRGTYSVNVKLLGYNDFTSRVNVVAGQTIATVKLVSLEDETPAGNFVSDMIATMWVLFIIIIIVVVGAFIFSRK